MTKANELRLCHTSDWHLGHQWKGVSRENEERAWLKWFVEWLARECVDALVVTGDIFDVVQPSHKTEKVFFDFLFELKQMLPDIQVFLLSGNHDSPHQLLAPEKILGFHGIHVVVSWVEEAGVLSKSQHVRLIQKNGVGVVLGLMPFLKPSDLRWHEEASVTDAVQERFATLHQAMAHSAREWASAKTLERVYTVSTGHMELSEARVSMESRRRFLPGDVPTVSNVISGANTDVMLLGHLHLPQVLGAPSGAKGHIRYAGSPIPMDMAERAQPHHVSLLSFSSLDVSIQEHAVPQTRAWIRIPETGTVTFAELLSMKDKGELTELLKSTPHFTDEPPLKAFVEVVFSDAESDAFMAEKLKMLFQGEAVEQWTLTWKHVETGGTTRSPSLPKQRFSAMKPEDVFLMKWKEDFPDEAMPHEIRDAFQMLLDECLDECEGQ